MKNYRIVMRVEVEDEKELEELHACIGDGCDDFEIIEERAL